MKAPNEFRVQAFEGWEQMPELLEVLRAALDVPKPRYGGAQNLCKAIY